MLKNFFAAMILAAALIVVGQTSTAQASEVYVGTYSDGSAVYLLTETIRHSNGYICTVRAGGDYLDYQFYYVRGLGRTPGYWHYSNSEGYSGDVYDGSSPVAAAILNYIQNNY